MSAQPEERPQELVPRPDLSFPSLRTALSRVAPAQVPEMLADRDVQFTRATEAGSFEPIKGFQLKWATVIEVKRRRDLDQRMEAAQHLVHTLDRDDPKWRAAMDEVRDVYNEARRAVTGG
ncbi:hypothetical protein [Streptomyces sp. Ac-502]|uniref:hypothetical protein n=1 Tax=Streptomyces sp. Ac-502 TaxID=3342801 RepID=UPI00386281B2